MAIFVNIGTDEASSELVNMNYVSRIKQSGQQTILIMHDDEKFVLQVPFDEFVRRIPPLEIKMVSEAEYRRLAAEYSGLAMAACGPL